MKKIICYIVGIMILSVFISCQGKESVVSWENGKLRVAASVIPIASMVNYIWWETVEVESLVPKWVEPYEYEISSEKTTAIQSSDLVFLLGIKAIDGFMFKHLSGVKSISLDVGIKTLEWKHETEEEHEIEGHVHVETSIEPHVWLSSYNALLIGANIRDALTKIRPEYKELYQKNYEEFIAELWTLFADFTEKNSGKELQSFFLEEDKFDYMLLELWIPLDKKHVNEEHEEGENQEEDDAEHNHELHDVVITWLDPLWKDDSREWYIQNMRENLEILQKLYK